MGDVKKENGGSKEQKQTEHLELVMLLVREMRLLLIRALNLTKSLVYAKKNARGRVWAVKTWTVSWTTTT